MPMLPEEGRAREAAEALMRLERDLFALWCRWLFRPLDDAGEARAREAFKEGLDAMDGALERIGGRGPFLLGKQLSMVDLLFAPFLERQNASLLYWKGFKLRNGGWANIDRCALRTALPHVWPCCMQPIQGLILRWPSRCCAAVQLLRMQQLQAVVQDTLQLHAAGAYRRCMPQVHAVVQDTLQALCRLGLHGQPQCRRGGMKLQLLAAAAIK
jgi:hypothetical protein